MSQLPVGRLERLPERDFRREQASGRADAVGAPDEGDTAAVAAIAEEDYLVAIGRP